MRGGGRPKGTERVGEGSSREINGSEVVREWEHRAERGWYGRGQMTGGETHVWAVAKDWGM